MKKEKFTNFILVLEIAAIILLHVARVNSVGLKDIARLKSKAVAPTLHFRPDIILPIVK